MSQLPQHMNPLTAQHYDQVHAGLDALANARQLIGAAQQVGIDTRSHTELVDHLEKQLTGIKHTFFPAGRPPQ